jgi:hypothetical protein
MVIVAATAKTFFLIDMWDFLFLTGQPHPARGCRT